MGLSTFKKRQAAAAEEARRADEFWKQHRGLQQPVIPAREYKGRSSGVTDIEKPGR